MSCKGINPREYDRSLTVQVNTRSIDGDITDSWANSETDVRAKLLRSSGSEDNEDGAPVGVEKRTYKILKSGRSWTVDKTRFKEADDTFYFYATAFRPHPDDKEIFVIEGVQRNDD